MSLAGVLMVMGMGAAFFLLGSGRPAAPKVATMAAPPAEPSRAYVYEVESADREGDVVAEPDLVSVAQVASVHADPDAGAGSEVQEQEVKAKPKAKPKPRRKPKPAQSDGYAIARLLKPAFAGCAPRDILAPGQPLRYKPTITISIAGGAFQNASVSVNLSHTDLAKIYFPADRKRPVTQADLDERQSRVASCIKKGIDKATIPADAPLKGVEGRVSFTFTHDGVPYGIKILGV